MIQEILRGIVVCAFASGCCIAQNGQSPHFEVASVKPVSRDVRMGYSGDAERMPWARIPLTNLISDAYQVGLDQISGPDWLSSEFYAISVKLPPGSTKEQYPQMMANLLAERFGLAVHRMAKEVSGYELTVAPGGTRLTASEPDTNTDAAATGAAGRGRFVIPKPDANGFPVLRDGSPFANQFAAGTERMTFRRSTIAFLALRLQFTLTRYWNAGQTTPVTDRTGIGGRFDFQVAIPAPSPRAPAQLRLETGQDAPAGAASDPDGGPGGISAALERQVGLKLKAVKTRLDFIVIDHVERVPTEN